MLFEKISKFSLLSVVCLLTTTVAFPLQLSEPWEAYKQIHGRVYGSEEDSQRMNEFRKRVAFVLKHNIEADMGKHTFRVALNKFSDMTADELGKRFSTFSPREIPKNFTEEVLPRDEVPSELDLRKLNMVTSVKDQEMCASGYAFGTMASLEGVWMKAKRKLQELSVQQILDCSQTQGNSACDGGLMAASFQYVIDNGGVATWESYGYSGREGMCHYDEKYFGASCSSYAPTTAPGEYGLQIDTATKGPVAVSFNANSDAFMHYKTGVYYDPYACGNDVNHVMVVIGYGRDYNLDFWLVKNSFGTEWGEDGFLRTARNQRNHCGIVTQTCIPEV